MALIDEPPGWRELQEKAQNERNPQKLMLLIDQINQLLTEWEKNQEVQPSSNSIANPSCFLRT